MSVTEQRPKQLWVTSENARIAFLISAWMTVVSFVAVATATVLAETQAVSLEEGSFGLGAFWFLFVLIGIFMLAQCYLWVGMIWFLIRLDNRSPGSKLAWIIFTCLGGPWGAAIYHFVAYRPLLRRVAV